MAVHFVEVEPMDLVPSAGAPATVVVATPNYEERSIGFLERFLGKCVAESVETTRVRTCLLWPQGVTGRVDLLEELKASHLERIEALLAVFPSERCVFSYPMDFNERKVTDALMESVESFRGEPLNLVVDISCMPKRVLVSVCDAVARAMVAIGADQLSVYFIYSSPERYAALRYAQNVGAVEGYFSGKPVHDWKKSDNVAALVFPGLQGYEGKLLYDELQSRVRSSVTAFVAVGGHDYHTALAIMRANQFLLEQRSIEVLYYFSFIDGLERLASWVHAEMTRLDTAAKARPVTKRFLLAAPFGPKVFTAASYFMLKGLQQAHPECEIEIAHVSGFQYLSLYSLGLAGIAGFKLVETGRPL